MYDMPAAAAPACTLITHEITAHTHPMHMRAFSFASSRLPILSSTSSYQSAHCRTTTPNHGAARQGKQVSW